MVDSSFICINEYLAMEVVDSSFSCINENLAMDSGGQFIQLYK